MLPHQISLRKPAEPELMHVQAFRSPVHDHLSDQEARGRAVHEAVAGDDVTVRVAVGAGVAVGGGGVSVGIAGAAMGDCALAAPANTSQVQRNRNSNQRVGCLKVIQTVIPAICGDD